MMPTRRSRSCRKIGGEQVGEFVDAKSPYGTIDDGNFRLPRDLADLPEVLPAEVHAIDEKRPVSYQTEGPDLLDAVNRRHTEGIRDGWFQNVNRMERDGFGRIALTERKNVLLQPRPGAPQALLGYSQFIGRVGARQS